MTTRLLALLLTSPLLLLLLGTAHARVHHAQLPKVTVSQPIAREATDHTDFRGRVEPGESVDACARVAGEVTTVAFNPGDKVKKGDLLFQLDPRLHKAALEKAEAEMERAQATVRRAAAEQARMRRMVEAAAATREEADIAAASAADAAAVLRAARAGVEVARLNLEFTQVRSPISGKVGRSTVAPGSFVAAAAPMVTIVSPDPVHVLFDIDEETALRLIRAAKAKKAIEVAALIGLLDETDLPHRGQVDFTDLRFNPSTNTAQARVTLPNADGRFLPGLSARVRLVEGKPYKAQLIASRALLSDAQGFSVLVVTPRGRVERRYVKLSRQQQGGLLPVTDGLQANDLVILDFGSLAARGDDPGLAVGMVVDPEKVPMPQRTARPESPFNTKGMRGDWGKKDVGKKRP